MYEFNTDMSFDDFGIDIDSDYLFQDYDDAEEEYYSTLNANNQEELDIQFE